MMETPLDVLSRAASMVETTHTNGDSLCKRSPPPPYENRESPGKELPSKSLKHDRIKDHQDLSHALNYDKDHAARLENTKKCTGTQTQFSFPADRYPNGAEHQSTDGYPPRPAPYYPPANHSPVTSNPPPHLPEAHDAPLNLSIQSSDHSRPSVISCPPARCSTGSAIAPYTTGAASSSYMTGPTSAPSYNTGSAGVPYNTGSTSAPYNTGSTNATYNTGVTSVPYNMGSASAPYNTSSNQNQQESTGGCDPIEEHFRRSLGRNYPDTVATKTTTVIEVPPATVAPVPTNTPSRVDPSVSITGSVDDHFARSLGNSTWSAIKAQKEAASFSDSHSVDDHFAKALGGDTWLRIKADSENMRSSKPSSPSQPSPQQSSPPVVIT